MEKCGLRSTEDEHGGHIGGGGVEGGTTRGKARTRDTLPLNDYRQDSLQKIHAHSSAETSGLGDSLQRIHTLSSTETSGYGDTVPSPTGVPSPDGYQLVTGGRARTGQYHRGGTNPGRRETELGQPGNPCLEYSAMYEAGHGPAAGPTSYSQSMAAGEVSRAAATSSYNNSPYPGGGAAIYSNTSYGGRQVGSRAAPMNVDSGHPTPVGQRRGSISPSGDSPTYGRSRSNSKTGVKGNFLGINTSSTWLKWSQDRRSSFKRRLDVIELKQKDMEKNRVSTPVRKARKESVMFVSPEMEEQHILKDELEEQQQKLHKQFNIQPKPKPKPAGGKKMKGNKNKNVPKEEEVKLSMNQWNVLIAFWEHQLFVRCRHGGTLLSVVALLLGVVSLLNEDWYRQTGEYKYLLFIFYTLMYLCLTRWHSYTGHVQ